MSYIQGTASAESLVGGPDSDEIKGDGGNDTISGLGGNDRLYGEDGDDVIDGGEGHDAVFGGAGSDTLHGGAGNDQIIANGADERSADIGSINYLYGDAGDDTLVGSDGWDFLDGGEGNDNLSGASGETLLGGAGNDRITLEGYGSVAGLGRIDGGDGDDQLGGHNAADVMYGGAGHDAFWGASGSDTLYGGDGDDTMFADGITSPDMPGDAGSINHLYGEAGNDYLHSGSGTDVLDGGAGNDTLRGWAGDTLLGGDGDDRLILSQDYTVVIEAEGVLDGGAGNDTVTLHEGSYRVTGGSGADLFENVYGVWSKGYTTFTDFRISEGDRLSFGERDPEYNWRVFRGSIENPYFSLRTGQAFSVKDYGPDFNQVWTWLDGGDTYLLYDADGSGTLSGADIVMRFQGLVALDASAFIPSTFTLKIDGTDAADTYNGTSSADVYRAVNGDDLLHGGGGDDTLYAGNGADKLWGDAGDDLLQGGLGDDTLDGGTGVDGAWYFGFAAQYVWSKEADGSWKVTGPDGTDTLRNIDYLMFGNEAIVSLAPAFSTEIAKAFTSILRLRNLPETTTGAYSAVADLIANGASTATVIGEIKNLAGATTSVATLAYQFFTGKIPGSDGVNYLVSPEGYNRNNLNSAYYQSFNLENRYINFAVNLGKNGEGKEAFAAKYGALSLFEATREAYKAIFGGAPIDAKVHTLIDTRIDYFASYGGDGPNGIGTKAAMVGWLLAEAEKAELGVMARSNAAWLTDLADGSAPFAINILDPSNGYYRADFIFNGG